MKVTVCFDDMRVIVPCGNGELTVLELINRAINRYTKARQKGTSFDDDVHVQCLQTLEEHAILDIDDLVVDVCDDKDMLIAVYDEVPVKSSHPKHALSDIDNNNIPDSRNIPYSPKHEDDPNQYTTSTLSDNDSGVAADSYGLSSNPASTHASLNSSSKPPRGIQRKFPQNKNASFRSSTSSNSPTSSSPELSKRGLLPPSLSRDLNRKSLSTNHPMLYSWIDQQDKYSSNGFFGVGSHETNDGNESEKSVESEEIQMDHHALKSVDIKPYTTADGQEIGLVVHDVVEGSYVDRVGELQTADRITEINGVSLTGYSNATAKDIYNEALKSEVIKLKRTRSHTFLKDHIKLENIPLKEIPDEVLKASKEAPKPVHIATESEPKEAAIEAPETDEKDSSVSGNKHVFHVNLLKGKDGLGFSITSKDVTTSNIREFFVKNVLNRGAAINDGRIKTGDELIKVNNVPVRDRSQAEVVKLLRTAEGMVILQLARPRSAMTEEELENNDRNISEENISTNGTKSTSPQPEDILTLTIPLPSHGTAGLGINVKGKRSDNNDEDQGIYVKAVIEGGAAAKDGRLCENDQLLCINDTSLIGLSNSDAMNVLRASMKDSMELGSIRIIIGRSQKSFNKSRSNSGYSSGGISPPFRDSSPILHGGSIIPQYSSSQPVAGKNSFEQDVDKEFAEMYLKKHLSPSHYNINRNKSYFKAVKAQVFLDSDNEDSKQGPSPRTVSVSSTELPEVQKSVYIESGNNTYNVEVRRSWNEQHKSLPTYEEHLQRRDTNSSASSHSSQTDTLSSHSRKADNVKFKLLPDKGFTIPKDEKSKKSLSLDSKKCFDSQNDEIMRCASLASQSSLDSVLVGPNQIPFSRDAFGRLSMSERKGRAQLDATKSDFFNKLKKFKSMEELRASHTSDDDDMFLKDESNEGFGKRTESVDTLISRIDEEERKNVFNRGTMHSASTPWNSAHPYDEQERKKSEDECKNSTNKTVLGFKPNLDAKLRSPKINRRAARSRPYSCILEDARARSSVLNNSFKSALDRTSGESSKGVFDATPADDKKKKGFLKGISALLRRKKQKSDEQAHSQSPEYFTDPPQVSHSHKAFLESRKPGSNSSRPLSMSEEMLMRITPSSKEGQALKYFQADQLQKELVQAKLEEMERKGKGIKKRKSDSNTKGHDSPSKSGYNTWNVHDVAIVREKSKQFFVANAQDSNRSSTRSAQLQRQSSLPPRNKKESVDFQRILPRVPSGQRQKSPEPSQQNNGYSSTSGSSSAPNSKPGSPIKKTSKSALATPLQRSITNDSRVSEPTHCSGRTTEYSTISQLTRKGGSVSISHKAQI